MVINRIGVRAARIGLLATVSLFGLAGAAMAQTAPLQTADEPQVEENTLDEVVVTGTRIRGVAATGSATVSLGREELIQSGAATPVEALREVPQIQNLGYDDAPHTAQNGNGNQQRGSTVNLRGLGSNATLLLIDGRRTAPTGNVFSFTEANQLPVSAIERVEVMADGASAIYGSDAVAGVVNYITRKNFDGLEVGVRGTTTDGYDQFGGHIMAGRSWTGPGAMGGGNLVISYDYDDRGGMLANESPFLSQDLRPFGGPDNRVRGNQASSSAPGNIIVARTGANPTVPQAGNFNYYGVRPGTNGTGLTASDLLLNQPNLLNIADYTTYLPEQTRNQASLYIDQDINSWLTVFYQAYGYRRESLRYNNPESALRTLPSTSPFYITGVPGVAPGAPLTVSFGLAKDLGRAAITHIEDTQVSQTIGMNFQLPADWRGEFSFTNSANRNCANCYGVLEGNIDVNALQAALNNGTYNPFSPNPASREVLERIFPAGEDHSKSILDDFILRLDGPVMQLPAGTLRAAVGAEHLNFSQARTSIGIKATSDTLGAYAERDVEAVYAEVYIPIIGEEFTLPLVQSLSISAAIRHETYSDFGDTTNPKIGVVWDVNDELTFRGAWGTSFRAPNLIEANPQFFSRVNFTAVANNAGDPSIPITNTAARTTNVVTTTGSNSNLVPEEATNFSYGFNYKPAWAPGLDIEVGYYNIEYTNQILGLQTYLSSFLASATNRSLYSPYIVAAPQPTTCVNGNRSTYNPLYLGPLGLPTLTPVDETNICSAAAILYGQNTNAATNIQDGIDLTVRYPFETSIGDFNVSLSGTKILGNELEIVPGGTVFDGTDRINYPVSLRGRAGLNWSNGPWGANAAINYVGSYTNDLPTSVAGVALPVSKVDAWITLDGGATYEFDGDAGPVSNLRVALTVRNLLNEDPPIVLSTNGNAFDNQNANPFGRMVTLQLTKTF